MLLAFHGKGKGTAMVDIKLSICNIRFEEGKLWKPRYQSLIDYSRAPQGFQLEPAFTLRSAARDETAAVEVVFQILPEEKVVFDVLPDGCVRWNLLADDPLQKPFVEVTVLDAEHRTCQVRWARTTARLTALRIRCRHLQGKLAADTIEGAWSLIEGGVYLVIIDPGDALPDPDPAQKEMGAPSSQTVQLLGIDEHHRPVYDMFCGQVPPELVREPAFRAAHGESLDFRIALDLPERYADTRFKADDDDQAEMFYAVPFDTKPASLSGAPVDPERKECTVQWRRPGLKCTPESAEVGCHQWNVANFYAELGFANQVVRVDPTVIEPPACDAGGVCGPPRSMD
jgi:hypothetical protein